MCNFHNGIETELAALGIVPGIIFIAPIVAWDLITRRFLWTDSLLLECFLITIKK